MCVCSLHSTLAFLGYSGRCADSFRNSISGLVKRVGSNNGLGPRVRVSILSHVDRRATRSLAVLLGSMGSILLSCALCVHLKTCIKAVPGRFCYAGLPASVCRFSRVSTCRIVLPTTVLQPTNLCDTTRLRCVLNVNACSFSCGVILFSCSLAICTPAPCLS